MLGMRWEGQRGNSLELTFSRGIAALPIASNTQSPKLYHKSEWISPLKTYLRACLLRRRLNIGLQCSTFTYSQFHSHSAYWQNGAGVLPCWWDSAMCACPHAVPQSWTPGEILLREAQIQRQKEGKCILSLNRRFSFAVPISKMLKNLAWVVWI